jgi:hypothetical protein
MGSFSDRSGGKGRVGVGGPKDGGSGANGPDKVGLVYLFSWLRHLSLIHCVRRSPGFRVSTRWKLVFTWLKCINTFRRGGGPYTDTDDPAGAPKIPSRNIPMPCKPILRLRT